MSGLDLQSIAWKLDNWYPQVSRRIEEASRNGNRSELFFDIDFDCRMKLTEVAEVLSKVFDYRVEFLAEGRTLKVEW